MWLLPSAVYSKSRAAGPCSRHHAQYRNWGSRPGVATLGNYRLNCSWTAEINPWVCQVCVGLRGRSGNKMTFTAAATSRRGRIYDLAARLSLLTLSKQRSTPRTQRRGVSWMARVIPLLFGSTGVGTSLSPSPSSTPGNAPGWML